MSNATLVRPSVKTGINAYTLQREVIRAEESEGFDSRIDLFAFILRSEWNQEMGDNGFKTVEDVAERFKKFGTKAETPAGPRGRQAEAYDTAPLQEAITTLESLQTFPTLKALYEAVAVEMSTPDKEVSAATVASKIHKHNLNVTTQPGKKGREKRTYFTAEQAQELINAAPEAAREWLTEQLLPVTSE